MVAPEIIGDDPLAHERIWDKLYWTLMPRGQTGYAAHALAAIDVALWDLKGKHFKQPIWRLLGGARSRVPVYVTFGFDFFDREQIAAAAKLWLDRGFKRLKMTVGNSGLERRDTRPLMDLIREDEKRVRAVREAIGQGPELFVDANCSLDFYHAQKVAELIRPHGISFFEEPITQNDVLQMAQLRRTCGIPLACGQNEGLAFRFRDLLVNQAIDYAQPNVVISGGYTQCVKIAGMAAAFNIPIANGGAWQYHNMHLQAGVSNGTPGRDPLSRQRTLSAHLYRPAGAKGWLYGHAGNAGAWLCGQQGRGEGIRALAARTNFATKNIDLRECIMAGKPRKKSTAKLKLVSSREEPPRARRFVEQRWLLDNIIRANGIDWDQPRTVYLNAPLGLEASSDFVAIRQRVQKFADCSPAFQAAGRRREARANEARDAGGVVTARENFLMAAVHWGAAQWPFDENNEENLFCNRRKRECYQAYAKLAAHRVEEVWIPFKGWKLPAWLHLPPGYSGGKYRWW